MSVPMEMDVVNTTEKETVKDIPPVPIKTYKWEDVRRERKRGRYPYTHLTKEPYNGEVNPSEFKMDTLRPSKSASTLEKSSSGVNIQDITDKSTNHTKDYLDVNTEGIIEMADSSNEDNISQYLDRDDDQSITIEQIDVPGPSKEEEKMEVDDAEDKQRAKSEEPKRKRKLSIESSYSRISLSKLGVMKKLREAKEKLKLPKFSFSKSESKLDIPKKAKKGKKSNKEKAKNTVQAYIDPPKKSDAPVYIHIPLKPPPGETDEFSYLEFEDGKSPSTSSSKPSSPTGDMPKSGEDGVETLDQNGKEGVQFIILTAPSDDEVLDEQSSMPDSPSSNGNKKFFDAAKLKDLKSLAKECEITPGTPIDGIIFEDVIQVEYVDEHNNPIGTTERSNILEVTEENLPKIEKQLSNRNLMKELQHELASSMDSINKINRRNTLKKLKEQHRSRSNEGLQHTESNKELRTQEAPELTTPVISVTKSTDDIKQKPKNDKTENKTEEKKEVPEPTKEEPQKEDANKEAMYDEEDGLKLSETAVQMINEELEKEQLPKTNEEQLKAAAKSGSVKKTVSFKRRSKQEDPHGIYEDVRVTSDGKTVDGKEQQVKELKVIDPSQSMSVDEEKSYLDDKIIKAKSLEEDYNKWSKLNDHEYEPINPPAENDLHQQLPSSDVPTTNSSEKNTSSISFRRAPPGSIRIPLREEIIVKSDEEPESGDVLTVAEMQERIEDQFFTPSTPAKIPDATTTTTANTSSRVSGSKENDPQESQAKKIQEALKNQAGKLRTKFKNIKKPNIQMPQRPNLERFKIQKPNISIPKIPDTMRVNMPSFTRPKKITIQKRTVKQYSTESNVGDSKKKLFDFSTYPRLFRKKKKTDDLDDDGLGVSATVPRAKKSPLSRFKIAATRAKETEGRNPDVIRIPLHSEASMDKEENNLSSRHRYEEENIDVDDDYLRESQQMNVASAFTASDFSRNRWNHGSFHGHNLNEIDNNDAEIKVTDLDNDVERAQTTPEPEMEQEVAPDSRQSDMRSVSSSGDVHRPGVLEKINSDEYFMQMGNYLSAEIREAFQQPTNPLAKLHNDDSFDREFDVSDHSIQEAPKRRPIKKPKRKKTPNVSKERIPTYDQDSEPEEYPQPFNEQPARPKRKNKHKKKAKDDKPPYQETIFVQEPEFEVMRKAASDNILLSDRLADNFHNGHFRQEYVQHYENERMQGIEQPNIFVSDPYRKEEMQYIEDDNVNLNGYEKDVPEAPPRKQRSLKSLVSENDSIVNEINLANQNFPEQNIEAYRLEHEYIIPTPEEPPIRPTRTRSRTRSQSRATNQPEDEEQQIAETELPCIEEPCIQQTCDYMGYAVIEKNKHREPPLPPPTRRKKSNNNSVTKTETKFFTVPRPLKEDMPVRPIRNYSTLVPKSQRSASNLCEEEKENVDLGQYIEIEEDEGHSHLQSGDVVQKMKDRPLPAPPRPPRKTKDLDKDAPFKDITHETNVDEEESFEEKIGETEVSVQTEPLPDDFVCEELIQEKGDKIITPTTNKFHPPITEFENIETVTHGALVVSPVADDFQEGPITQFSRSTEKIITIRREVDHEDETSDVPENFQTLKDPQPRIIERIIERPALTNPEVEVLKAQKLQVSDLDVDRLMVNELLASKIKVSEIDGDSISVAEINPKTGSLVIGGLELPINFIKDVMDRLAKAESPTDQASTQTSHGQEENITKSGEPCKGENIISSPEKEDTALLLKQSEEQSQDVTLPFDKDQIKSKIDKVLPLKDDQQQPVKLQETILPTEDISRNNLNEEYLESKRLTPEEDPELSPSTLKATIDYLDNLITEETNLTLVESIQKVLDDDLESTVESNIVRPTETTATPKQISTDEKSESVDLEEIPPLIPDTSEEERLIGELKSSSSEQKKTPFEKQLGEPPKRPPRQSDGIKFQQSQDEIFIPSQIIENSHNLLLGESTPPPRPPDPEDRLYLRSQPPPSFYVLRSPTLDEFIDEDIPMPPRRKRPPRPPSRTSSEEAPPATPRTRRHRTPEPSIPQLTGQLTKACVTAGERAFKRLLKHITMNVLRNADGKQDLHVMILILLILIAGLILLGNEGNPIVHHYHWEYFNPPKDL